MNFLQILGRPKGGWVTELEERFHPISELKDDTSKYFLHTITWKNKLSFFLDRDGNVKFITIYPTVEEYWPEALEKTLPGFSFKNSQREMREMLGKPVKSKEACISFEGAQDTFYREKWEIKAEYGDFYGRGLDNVAHLTFSMISFDDPEKNESRKNNVAAEDGDEDESFEDDKVFEAAIEKLRKRALSATPRCLEGFSATQIETCCDPVEGEKVKWSVYCSCGAKVLGISKYSGTLPTILLYNCRRCGKEESILFDQRIHGFDGEFRSMHGKSSGFDYPVELLKFDQMACLKCGENEFGVHLTFQYSYYDVFADTEHSDVPFEDFFRVFSLNVTCAKCSHEREMVAVSTI